jgi:hypothetical protein
MMTTIGVPFLHFLLVPLPIHGLCRFYLLLLLPHLPVSPTRLLLLACLCPGGGAQT